jgi:hypothetical protein
MKIVGFIMIILGLASLRFGEPALFVGAHSTSRLWQRIEPLSEAALDAANSSDERRQRYTEISSAKRELEVYAREVDAVANRAGLALTSIGLLQTTLGAFLVMKKKKPNQALQRNAGSRPASNDSPVSEKSPSFGPRG